MCIELLKNKLGQTTTFFAIKARWCIEVLLFVQKASSHSNLLEVAITSIFFVHEKVESGALVAQVKLTSAVDSNGTN